MPLSVVIAVWFVLAVPVKAEPIYSYTNDAGVTLYTDDLGKIPESARPQAAPVEPAGNLVIAPMEETPETASNWKKHPAVKVASVLVFLVVFAWISNHFVGGFLIRSALKFLVVVALGSVAYAALMTQGCQPASTEIGDPPAAVLPYLPNSAPIERAKEAAQSVEKAQNARDSLIDSVRTQEEK